MRRNLKRLGLTMALVGILSAWAAPAWAPKHLFTGPLSVTGDCNEKGTPENFIGAFDIVGFTLDRDRGEVMAEIELTGTCGSVQLSRPVLLVLPVSFPDASCDDLSFELPTIDTVDRVGGFYLTFPVAEWFFDGDLDRMSFRAHLCKAAELVDDQKWSKLVRHLNKMVERDYSR